jgi:hypothetical protein
MQVTLIPISAKQVPDTNPTYPLPTIAILIDLQFLKSRVPRIPAPAQYKR